MKTSVNGLWIIKVADQNHLSVGFSIEEEA